ncbi:hypothetical protein VTN77DRAFT_5971 [Rasamsonia byssochlamydoides]|uniref:uncharacterized protein n=1 Tax=Rasamsonia byssochlamydoides TaxID=89139 RepID=UPI00374350D2
MACPVGCTVRTAGARMGNRLSAPRLWVPYLRVRNNQDGTCSTHRSLQQQEAARADAAANETCREAAGPVTGQEGQDGALQASVALAQSSGLAHSRPFPSAFLLATDQSSLSRVPSACRRLSPHGMIQGLA